MPLEGGLLEAYQEGGLLEVLRYNGTYYILIILQLPVVRIPRGRLLLHAALQPLHLRRQHFRIVGDPCTRRVQ